jgi:ribosomal protein S6--L-glutamate ligase
MRSRRSVAPPVIKLFEGTQGHGVILAETAASAKFEAFGAAHMNILVQEYIKDAGGNDMTSACSSSAARPWPA